MVIAEAYATLAARWADPPYISLYLPISSYISLYLPISPYISLHLPTSPYISIHLPTSPYLRLGGCRVGSDALAPLRPQDLELLLRRLLGRGLGG